MAAETNYGIWIGENATIAITEKLQIVFLRLQKDNIISILRQKDEGVIGAVYGFGIKFDSHCEVGFKNKSGENYIDLHSKDKIVVDGKRLTYIMYDDTEFDCILAEKIILSDNFEAPRVNPDLTLAKRQELWNLGTFFQLTEESVYASIEAHKYSVCFDLNYNGSKIYCRVGQNGYCEKGRAMLSTVCLRPKEVRMLESNLESLNEYKPMLDSFVAGGCTFPLDGGWYWSLDKADDDLITLYGCGGASYKTYRVRRGRYEVVV